MNNSDSVEIESVILRMISKKGFIQVFWEELINQRKENPKITHESIFNELNEKYFENIGEYRYSSYDSFRQVMNKDIMAHMLTNIEVRDIWNKILKFPEFINELTDYERAELLEFANQIKGQAFDFCINLADMPGNQKYGKDRSEVLQYFLDKSNNYVQAERMIEIINQIGSKRNPDIKQKDLTPEALRRTIAFCVCLHFKNFKFDIGYVDKMFLENYAKDTFCDPLEKKWGKKKSGMSPQKVMKILCGYENWSSGSIPDETVLLKAIFTVVKNHRIWTFNEVNYNYLMKEFETDFLRAGEIVETLK